MVDETFHHDTSGVLAALCEHFGIATAYHDAFGTRRQATTQSVIALLGEFGVRIGNAEDARRALGAVHAGRWAEALPAVRVVDASAAEWNVPLRLPLAMRSLRWQLTDEAGRTRHGEADAFALHESQRTERDGTWLCERVLPMTLALDAGYHRLRIDGLAGETLVLASPGRCYRPPAVQEGGRVWGPAVQLYGLRSPRNWGIGDFGDLEELATRMAAQGADIIGVNPLHALFAANPVHASPYSPSSRQQLNTLYIDVEAADEFAQCEPARKLVESPAFQARLAALRAEALVDYAGVASAKLEVLALLFAHFRERHLPEDGAPDEEGLAFLSFVAQRGEGLRQHALFETLHAHFLAADPAMWGWPVWPAAYRDPDSAEVTAFAVQHAQRLQFHQYLQWQAARQLARAGERCAALGMGVGLYVDLAVSVDRAGSDAWTAQAVFAGGPASARRPTSSTLRARTGGCRRCDPTGCAPTGTASSSRRCAPACTARAPCASTTSWGSCACSGYRRAAARKTAPMCITRWTSCWPSWP